MKFTYYYLQKTQRKIKIHYRHKTLQECGRGTVFGKILKIGISVMKNLGQD
jgi:hypothetical protein